MINMQYMQHYMQQLCILAVRLQILLMYACRICSCFVLGALFGQHCFRHARRRFHNPLPVCWTVCPPKLAACPVGRHRCLQGRDVTSRLCAIHAWVGSSEDHHCSNNRESSFSTVPWIPRICISGIAIKFGIVFLGDAY